ncbi:hypothetical protein GGR92_004005 [Spirosoma lacussanchae]
MNFGVINVSRTTYDGFWADDSEGGRYGSLFLIFSPNNYSINDAYSKEKYHRLEFA